MPTYSVLHGDCRDVMATLDADSIEAIVSDPPYGLSFMGKGWDHGVPGAEFWAEALRVAKPGAHLLAFGGTRTYHRLACAIEDAGWEIRDCVMWVYGSGFPKSHDVSKAIDKAAGAEREKEWIRYTPKTMAGAYDQRPWLDEARASGGRMVATGAPATDAARQWQGWGTALKPAWEPIIVARKPLVGTVAENVLTHGTGAINVNGCRVGTDGGTKAVNHAKKEDGRLQRWDEGYRGGRNEIEQINAGRWPANLIHDGSEEVLGLFPNVKTGSVKLHKNLATTEYRQHHSREITSSHTGDSGSAARFFYCAKASKRDRDEGCEGLEETGARPLGISQWEGQTNGSGKTMGPSKPRRNHHPTVKPTDLMRYLCRLVTPPGGTVLDPFCGSGSTGKAAILEGFQFVGIEREDEYVAIAKARCSKASLECSGEPDQRDSGVHSFNVPATDTVPGNGDTGKPEAKSDHQPRVHRRKSGKRLHNKTYVQLELF